MQDRKDNILVWLPSPMGDAVLCTPALRSIRKRFASSNISFLGNSIVRSVLSPCDFNDTWIESKGGPFAIASQLKRDNFTHAILLKNSFAAALAVLLAKIPHRIGYARECRALMLTEKLRPEKLPNGKYKPVSMLDYYLAVAERLGGETENRRMELNVDEEDKHNLHAKLPELTASGKSLAILVPGGAFGPSKCWPAENYARIAERLIEDHDATVVVSIAPNERQIADDICHLTSQNLINLAKHPITLGELKALYSTAEIVITNDTGPRHIAIALQRKVVTLFGPNDPAWTETDCENEIQIIGNVPCSPCARPECSKSEHLCMETITVEAVCDAAEQLIRNERTNPVIFARP